MDKNDFNNILLGLNNGQNPTAPSQSSGQDSKPHNGGIVISLRNAAPDNRGNVSVTRRTVQGTQKPDFGLHSVEKNAIGVKIKRDK